MNEKQQALYDMLVRHIMSEPKLLEAQSDMAVEEAIEMSLELMHMKRGKTNRKNLVSEIADLENMLGQIKAMHCITEDELSRERTFKVVRTLKAMGLIDCSNCAYSDKLGNQAPCTNCIMMELWERKEIQS